jgi:hypothetical protein
LLQRFDGKEWDFVLDVDIADDAPPLKLAFQQDENPHTVAAQFLAKHHLPVSYKEQIVRFIIQNGVDPRAAIIYFGCSYLAATAAASHKCSDDIEQDGWLFWASATRSGVLDAVDCLPGGTNCHQIVISAACCRQARSVFVAVVVLELH